MPTTRERALAAAVRVVGEHGVRALTHARVDAEAHLPKGSTSNWFRTRDALVAGIVVWIAEEERADLAPTIATVRTADDLVAGLCTLLDAATGRHAIRTRARYALFLEIPPGSQMQAPLREQRARFEQWLHDLLRDLGAPEPQAAAAALLAFTAGLIVNRVTVAPDAELRPLVELAVRGCVGA